MRRSNSLFYLILFILTVGIASQATAGRYYDPAYGRWTTFDPALNEKSPQELLELQNGKLFSHSPYSYAYDNPLKFIDPDGKTPIPWDYLDIGFAVWSVKDFLADPSWSNAGWAVYDVVAAVAPILPSSRYFRAGGQIAESAIDAWGAGRKADKSLDAIRKGDKALADLINKSEFEKMLKKHGNGVQLQNRGSAKSAFRELQEKLGVKSSEIKNPDESVKILEYANRRYILRLDSEEQFTIQVFTKLNPQEILIRFANE